VPYVLQRDLQALQEALQAFGKVSRENLDRLRLRLRLLCFWSVATVRLLCCLCGCVVCLRWCGCCVAGVGACESWRISFAQLLSAYCIHLFMCGACAAVIDAYTMFCCIACAAVLLAAVAEQRAAVSACGA
jgi:hypothetical protein